MVGAAQLTPGATERRHAERLDAIDPLAGLRDRFVIDDPERIYLDGNSLGRLPRATPERLAERIAQWGGGLVLEWPAWLDLPARLGDRLAASVLGARAGEVVLADSTTVNLFKLAAAAMAGASAGRTAVVTDAGNFPTDRYVLEGLAAARGAELRLFDTDPLEGPTAEQVTAACAPGDVALVCLSHVAYRSGALADLATITAAAHAAGALVLWDLSHSAGAVPIELEASGADLAVGCTYKYLNAGPGSPAFLYVRTEHQPRLRSPIWGWFGHREQFAMGPRYEPLPDARRFLAGTPSILGLTAVEVGVELVAEAGIGALAAKAAQLTELLIALHDAWLAPLGFTLGSPRARDRRGAHVAVCHADGWRVCRALIEHAGVVPDFRRPDAIRLGVPSLYTRFVDAWDAMDRLRDLVERGVHLGVDDAPRPVT